MKPLEIECDVLVAGGGSAGVSAAKGAASCGAKVVLVERYGFLGGMATAAEVGTICGLYETGPSPTYLVRGFAREIAEKLRTQSSPVCFGESVWYLPYDPFELACVLDETLTTPSVDVRLHTTFHSAGTDGDRVLTVEAWERDRAIRISFGSAVDCSGDASLCAIAGEELMVGAAFQAGAAVFALSGAERDMPIDLFKRHVVKSLLDGISRGELGEWAKLVSVVPGGFGGGIARFKLSLPECSSPERRVGEMEAAARTRIRQTARHLIGDCEPLRRAKLSHSAAQIGIRTGRRPEGLHVLSESDVLDCRKAPDRIASCSWPIEVWSESRSPAMTYLPVGDHYDIPLGCVRSRRFENLFFAGRNLSASERAIASARVIGACLSTGYAAGVAAALHSKGRPVEETLHILER